ncbi:MAG: cytochrome c [Saprospiraceae bacterium]
MSLIKKITVPFIFVALMYLSACQQPGGNVTGSEYMPDMSHSIAYEANYYNYYYNNTWGTEEEYYSYALPRQPVNGTIPRGFAGNINANNTTSGIGFTPNGSVPYYYNDTEEERLRAITEIIINPYPITENGLASGKELYNIYCGICHGENGDGLGYLVRDANPAKFDEGGKYPVQPANMILEEFINSSNGRYYHAIVYGKNMMGGYTDKLSFQERWQVIHYIRSLQAKSLKLTYNQLENTLNSVDRPAGKMAVHTEDEHMDEANHVDHDDHEDKSHH